MTRTPSRIYRAADRVRIVAERWRQQYQRLNANAEWGSIMSGDSEKIYLRLLTVGTVEEIDEIVGNQSWTRTSCDGCRAACVDVIELGDLPGYESATVTLCVDCARETATELTAFVDEHERSQP